MSAAKKKAKLNDDKPARSAESRLEAIFEKPWFASYGFMAPRIGPIVRRLKGLNDSFARSNLLIDFSAYVSFLLFGTIMAFVVTFVVTASVNMVILETQINYFMGIKFPFMTLPLLISCFSALIAFLTVYIYPSYVANDKKGKIEQFLLQAVSYMSILATSGMSPERIFRSLATKPEIEGIHEQARLIVRDIDMLGIDFITALNKAIQRSPSKMFAGLLEGFVSTIYSGGDLYEYLKVRTEELTRWQTNIVKGFTDRLGMLAESAVAVIAVFPLIFLVSFSVTALLPGGMLTSPLFIYVMVYLILPFLCLIFIAALRTGTPKL
jgi:flagellar protein FlaJ